MPSIQERLLANRCVVSEEDVRILSARLSLYGFASPQEYKRSEEWKALRESMKTELPYRCQICDSTQRLALHHKTYISICAEIAGDLAWVCSKCHFLPALHVFHPSYRRHWKQKRRKKVRAVHLCSEYGCKARHFGHGKCSRHYYLARKQSLTPSECPR